MAKIRKAFKSVDIDEVIINLPKVGYRINPNLSCQPNAAITDQTGGQQQHSQRNWGLSVLIGVTMLTSILFFVVQQKQNTNSSKTQSNRITKTFWRRQYNLDQ